MTPAAKVVDVSPDVAAVAGPRPAAAKSGKGGMVGKKRTLDTPPPDSTLLWTSCEPVLSFDLLGVLTNPRRAGHQRRHSRPPLPLWPSPLGLVRGSASGLRPAVWADSLHRTNRPDSLWRGAFLVVTAAAPCNVTEMFPRGTWYEYTELGRPGAAAVQRVDPGPMYLAVKPATVYVVGCFVVKLS